MAEITTVEQSACLIDCIPIIAAYIPTVRFLSPNLPLLKSKFETTNRQNTEDWWVPFKSDHPKQCNQG